MPLASAAEASTSYLTMRKATLGIGMYRGARSPTLLKAALVEFRLPVLDTAPNYQAGHAQTRAARAIEAAHLLGIRPRLMTKVGFIPPGSPMIERFASPRFGSLNGHCLHPEYIAHQVEENVRQLGSPIDVLLLHNPEVQRHRTHQQAFMTLLKMAFRTLEEQCERGLIKRYGVSTWNGLNRLFDVDDLFAIAQDVSGGASRLSCLQFPVSLMRRDYVAAASRIACAPSSRLELYSSAPLASGSLPPLMSDRLTRFIGPGMTAAQASLLFALSIPGISVVLTSPRTSSQLSAAVDIAQRERLPEDKVHEIMRIFDRGAASA